MGRISKRAVHARDIMAEHDWIVACGGTLDGYRKHYPGSNADAIFLADRAELRRLALGQSREESEYDVTVVKEYFEGKYGEPNFAAAGVIDSMKRSQAIDLVDADRGTPRADWSITGDGELVCNFRYERSGVHRECGAVLRTLTPYHLESDALYDVVSEIIVDHVRTAHTEPTS